MFGTGRAFWNPFFQAISFLFKLFQFINGMNERVEETVERLSELVREKPLVFAAVVIVIFLIVLFWNLLFLVLRGLLFAAIALAIIFGSILLAAKLRYRKPSLKSLFRKKKKLLRAIKIAEKRYMRRKLSEKDFNKFFKEKQSKLIEVEALIDQQYNKENSEKVDKQVLEVQAKKRHVLRNLLDEKRRIIKEIDLAEKRYLRRKIDAKTYQQLVQKNQKELIDLEASIKGIYEEANISKVMSNLKQKLLDLEKKKKEKKKDRKHKAEEKQVQVAKEIAEQVSGK